ncbi:16S ribosomal RNA methyltransferase KsgA/Dim1 family protein [Symmachiella macrocystis]|uniref:16S ribosomal RNA methyltransferase KsgA/Dim1 family protein n=1 Tax=Symmachiella macrocystis TaxID=2527985 RepID=A0A5C6BUH3_9PLAN|nr:rRNA adenine N-6-methyltransferase family protein [Symmachiella macrocystis]TWU14334.1 16S ribosomal RNA methyltransferase KsgA/Dim1 family protein [Symmachiella macrocystis]
MSELHTNKVSSPGDWLRFVRGFLANPNMVASIVPSSQYLQHRVSLLPCVQSAEFVVELGPGTGETTLALLRRMPRTSQLLCIEVVPEFVEHLRQISDPRLVVVQGNAFDLADILAERNLPMPNTVVSGIPFSHISLAEGRDLVRTIHSVLALQGTFLAYQFRDRISELANEVFGEPQTSFVFWNIPPLRIWQWEKDSHRAPLVDPTSRGTVSMVSLDDRT